MDDSQYSQTKKAKAARNWRQQTSQKKRFGGTLEEFIRIKYGNIYEEYLEFFQRLDENPNIRDLTRTPMFRKWVKSIKEERQQAQASHQEEVQNQASVNQAVHQPESLSDILSLTVQEILPEAIPEERQQAQTSHQEEVQNQAPVNQAVHQPESLPNILSSVVQEILPEGIPEQISSSLKEFLPQVNPEENETLSNESIEDIIAELEQDQAVREILDPVVDEIIDRYNIQVTHDDDEGIELNFIDEIDLQPFDYDLEIDF